MAVLGRENSSRSTSYDESSVSHAGPFTRSSTQANFERFASASVFASERQTSTATSSARNLSHERRKPRTGLAEDVGQASPRE